MSQHDDDDHKHKLVKVAGDSPFASLPLFLPANAAYDAGTNTVVYANKQQPALDDDENADNNNDDDASQRLVKVPNAGWDMLQSVQAPLSIISCIGPYRTGKSLLMSRFLDSSRTFSVGPTLEGCTVGIWISTTALVHPKTGCYQFMVDAQGLGDPLAGDEASNARMALACLLLSSVVLFNNTSHPDRGSLQFLRCLSTVRQRIPASQDRRSFPSFVWVFRDFFLQLPRRKETNEPYTLEEYMLERVLQQQPTTAATGGGGGGGDAAEADVVDSLLHDFAALRVLKVGHPKRQGQHPLSPDEMAHLGDLDWTELDEDFRADIQKVIATCLELASPFTLGRNGVAAAPDESSNKFSFFGRNKQHDGYARGKAYAKWCETVLELVNSTGIIPNLPDLQQQLAQQMADEQLSQSVATFETELENYWNSCPVYSSGDGASVDLVALHDLKAVAEVSDLNDRAQELFMQQKQAVLSSGSITSPAILQATLQELEVRCIAKSEETKAVSISNPRLASNLTSIYARICLENSHRSQVSCEALMNSLYTPVQSIVHNDPASMPLKEFQAVIGSLQTSYRLQARGPAKDTVMQTHLVKPSEADFLFIAKVTEKNKALQDSLSKQASMSKVIQEKETEVSSLNQNLEQVKAQTKLQLAAMEKEHNNSLQKALEEQRRQEQEQRDNLRADMEQQLKDAEEKAAKERQENEARLKLLEEQGQQRLKVEVEAREEKLNQEKKLFEQQIESLKQTADAELREKLELVQSKSQKEQERIEEEMTHRLEESENRLHEEIRIKEVELAKTTKDLEEKRKAEEELIERLERRICPEGCHIM